MPKCDTKPLLLKSSTLIPKPRQIPLDLFFQLTTPRKLLLQLRRQPCHLLGKGFAILHLICRADIAPRRQHEVVLLDLLQRRRAAESGLVGVVFPLLLGMKSIGDLGDIFRLEIAQHAILHITEATGIDEEHFVGTICQGPTRFLVKC